MPAGITKTKKNSALEGAALRPAGQDPAEAEARGGTLGKVARPSKATSLAGAEHQARRVKQVGMASVTGLPCRRGVDPPSDAREDLSVLKATLDTMQQGLVVVDRDLRVSAFNEWLEQLIGFPPGIVRLGATIYELIASAFALGHYGSLGLEDVCHAWLERLERRQVGKHLSRLRDGRFLSVIYVPIAEGGWAITYEDISERIQVAKALAAQRDRFDAALANMPHGLSMFDRDRRLILCNPAYARLYALPPELTEPGTPLENILAYRDRVGSAPVDMATYFDVMEEAHQRQGFASRTVALRDARTIRITHNPNPRGGYVATHEDITASIRAEAEIRHLAAHDALTGLPNRSSMRGQLVQALARVRGDEKLAVHCLDLDAFKVVNDTLGNAVGDLVLKAATERFTQTLGEADVLARLGGDDFVVLQTGVEGPQDAIALARQLVEALAAPLEVEGNSIAIGASIGVAFCPNDGVDADEVLKKAEIALHRAKSDGRNTFRFFEPAMDRPLQARRQIERDLRAALAAGDFRLHYQPVVDAGTSTVKGFEALVRWTHPERGPVSPLDFIPVSEETGLIVPMGEWVLRQACRDAAQWPAGVRVAVNLSPVQFRRGNLTEIVLSALTDAGLPASRLELEITESVLLIDSEATLETLHQFRKLGIRIALDDFGTGYSSLSYLRSFPFDKIKIDKSFIRDLADVGDCMAIVKAVAGLGSALGMTTTAEGVETEDQLRHVREQGCTEVQGFYFSRPRPADEVAAMLGGLASEV